MGRRRTGFERGSSEVRAPERPKGILTLLSWYVVAGDAASASPVAQEDGSVARVRDDAMDEVVE